jgi:hypothetical protein
LNTALRALCEEYSERHAIDVRYNGAADVGGLSPAAASCLYRIAQESLSNGPADFNYRCAMMASDSRRKESGRARGWGWPVCASACVYSTGALQ